MRTRDQRHTPCNVLILNDISPITNHFVVRGVPVKCCTAAEARCLLQRTPWVFILSLCSLYPTMASMPSPTCGTIAGPIADTTTYTYSNLDTGFIPPESCLQPTYTSLPDGYDSGFTGISTITVGDSTSTSTAWARVYRGREPACFPSKYPKACEYQGTIQQQKNYIYSPGTCPSGYAPATAFFEEPSSSITTATCCPR